MVAVAIDHLEVSTRASARDATRKRIERMEDQLFQPARPRGTRPAGREHGISVRVVSTRASARDATEQYLIENAGRIPFQPARPRGTRLLRHVCLAQIDTFQPARPRGTRLDVGAVCKCGVVSTRASARDATLRRKIVLEAGNSFNPRVREGRDAVCKCGVRSAGGFNPRVREGRDDDPFDTRCSIEKFQPARPRGTRPSSRASLRQTQVSTRASARDATDCHLGPFRRIHVSTRASARDATRSSPRRLAAQSRFNPRVREGRDALLST